MLVKCGYGLNPKSLDIYKFMYSKLEHPWELPVYMYINALADEDGERLKYLHDTRYVRAS